ncbi:MAG: YceI family protein [Chitinophagaceae bacterium]|nr:YceI family protein [Chitinophagaceae bacterium]
MNKKIGLGFLWLTISFTAVAQKKIFTKNGIISFTSETRIEKIKAINKKALAVIDLEHNKIEFAVLIGGFEFKKALMQEHFNENYLESDKFPKALFKGSFNQPNVSISINENKTQRIQVQGNLTLHGVTKEIAIFAIITVKNKIISAQADFSVLLTDYDIKVPSVVSENINKEVQINVNVPSFSEM